MRVLFSSSQSRKEWHNKGLNLQLIFLLVLKILRKLRENKQQICSKIVWSDVHVCLLFGVVPHSFGLNIEKQETQVVYVLWIQCAEIKLWKTKTSQVLCVPFVVMVKFSSRLWNEKQKMFFHIEFRTCIQKKKQCSTESSWATQLVFRPVGTICHFFFSKCFAQIWKICLQGAPLPGGLAKCSKPAQKKRKATKKAKKISYSYSHFGGSHDLRDGGKMEYWRVAFFFLLELVAVLIVRFAFCCFSKLHSFKRGQSFCKEINVIQMSSISSRGNLPLKIWVFLEELSLVWTKHERSKAAGFHLRNIPAEHRVAF